MSCLMLSVNDRIYNHLGLHMHMEIVSILVLRYKSNWRFWGKYIQFQSVWGLTDIPRTTCSHPDLVG